MSDNHGAEELTVLVQAAVKGDPAAQNSAAMRVYDELHILAQKMMGQEPNQTL